MFIRGQKRVQFKPKISTFDFLGVQALYVWTHSSNTETRREVAMIDFPFYTCLDCTSIYTTLSMVMKNKLTIEVTVSMEIYFI